jgi:RNA polymerase sigma-70 factor (ECF subfamily)
MDHLRALLYVAAKNASLNNLRSNKSRLSFEPLIQSEDLWNKDPDTFTQMIQIELIQAIFEEVERLPQKQKQVFNLTYFEDKTAEEIAKQLNISVASVYTNRSRALSTLRLIFKSKNDLLALAFFLLFKQ